jgi:DNA-directed RNA polymerase omega subunit
MITRGDIGNAFEFVVVASRQARQLLEGCTPRVEPLAKETATAMREVRTGAVRREDAGEP